MKKLVEIVGLCLILSYGMLLYSCQKDEHTNGDIGKSGLAKVNVIDAVVTGGDVKVNVSPKEFYWNSLPNNQSAGGQVLGGFTLGRLFMVPAGQNTVMQVVSVNDTTKMWYNNTAQLSAGKVYSLYLSGTPGNIKSLLHEEANFPASIVRDAVKPTPPTDSIVNIRFINLSPSVPKVDVKLVGKGNIITNLTYQQFSDFKAYSATSAHEIYTIEIRRSSDQELIATYDFPVYYFRFKSAVVFMMGIYDPKYELPIEYTDRYRLEAVAY